MKYFLFGFLLATLGLSLLESLTNIITGVTELIISMINVKIVKYNQDIQKLSSKTETQVIGFQIPTDEGDFDFDD